MGAQGAVLLGRALSGPMLLESLDLSNCNFGNTGAVSLLKVLMQYCPCLETLSLTGNLLGLQHGSVQLATAFAQVYEDSVLSLVSLHLARNHLSVPPIHAILRPVPGVRKDASEGCGGVSTPSPHAWCAFSSPSLFFAPPNGESERAKERE